MIKTVVNDFLRKFGYQIKKNSSNDVFSMDHALRRCISRGLNANTVIDVGASDGRWSRMCLNYLPDANYLLIEAQAVHKDGLNKIISEFNNVDYILKAAGNRQGKIYFDCSDELGGLASDEPNNENYVEVPVTTIDEEILLRNLKPPYIIKLDTHGYEVPILEGARNTLNSTSLIIIETYNYKLTKESLRYFEMCDYMEKLGFLPIELVDFMTRKYDLSFWQMDTFFIPSSSNAFNYNQYI